MDRLVYAPKAFALVKAEKGIVDLSPYLVSGSVSRKLDQVSTAELEFRNPGKRFTEGADGPVFNPMDPVVILMKRLHNRPVQVFTGYIDSAPYATLRPGTVRITASCTLKKLLYTYYDPGLPFFHKFIHRQGWTMAEGLGTLPDNAGQTVDDQQNQDLIDGKFPEPLSGGLNDASFGNMLYDTLLYIGNWHPDTIYIEDLPDGIIDLVEGIFYQIEQASREERKEFRQLLKQMLENTGQLGNGNPDPDNPVTGRTGTLSQPEVAMLWVLCGGDEAWADHASAISKAENGTGEYDRYNGSCCYGIWQYNTGDTLSEACAIDPVCATKKTVELTGGGGGSWDKWQVYTEGTYTQYLGGSAGYKRLRNQVINKFPELG
jgi:hypothetical protein